jgi:hypothetical protein
MRYVIKAPGRTGAHMIADFIRRAPNMQFEYKENNSDFTWQDIKDNCVILDHSCSVPENTSEYTLIISKRKNTKLLLLSHLVAGITLTYRSKATPPKTKISSTERLGSLELLAKDVSHRLHYFDEIKDLPWANVHEVYYEDFLTNPGDLCTIVNYDHKTDWSHLDNEKALSYKDVFSNPHEMLVISERICKKEKL